MPFRTKKTAIWQYDIVVGGSRFRGSCGTDQWEEAKNVEARVRADAKAQKAKGGSYTLSEAIGTYYRDKAIGTPSQNTTKSQAKVILEKMDGSTRIDRLTDAHIMAYVAKDRATCSNATVNRRLQMLGRALRHMAKFYKAEVPALELKAAETREPKERVRELSMDEQARMFDALPTEHHALVSFALLTGARIGTICGLLWSDVDMASRTIFFRLKDDRVMTFPMSPELRALLSALPRSNVIAHRRYVFTRLNAQTLERVPVVSNGGVFNADFRKALAGADIVDFRFHDCRHTFATRMLRQCKNLKLVSKLLGHTLLETTSRYAHVLVDDMRAELDAFSPLTNTVPQTGPQTKTKGH
jgi:integrase